MTWRGLRLANDGTIQAIEAVFEPLDLGFEKVMEVVKSLIHGVTEVVHSLGHRIAQIIDSAIEMGDAPALKIESKDVSQRR